MKKKTSLTLSEDLLEAIDAIAGERGRSALVEEALRHWLRERARAAIHEHDVQVLNERAAAFDEVALDVLAYQAHWEAEGGDAP